MIGYTRKNPMRRKGRALGWRAFDVRSMRKKMMERGKPKIIQSQRSVKATFLDHDCRRKCP